MPIVHAWGGEPLSRKSSTQVELRREGGGLALRIDAPFHDDPPPPGPPGPTPGLWEHEVVEVFLAAAETQPTARYCEVEISPHGHYLVLRLKGVRQVVEEGLPLKVSTRILGQRWQAEARLPLTLLPKPPWRGNAFALHGPADRRRFELWHPLPGAEPDFHQPEHFPLLPL